MKELVTKIDTYRRKFAMKQEELAERVGVRRETISRLEKGMYNPSLKLAYDIAEVFGVSIEDVFQFVEVEDEATRRANMVFHDRESSEEIEIMLKGLIQQTRVGKIQWECTYYNPLGILYEDDWENEGKNPKAILTQAFDAKTVVGNRPVFLNLTESITVDDGKGDLLGDIAVDVDDGTTRKDFSLSFAEKYRQLDANGVAEKYRGSLLGELYDTLVPILAKSEATAFGFSFANFQMCEMPPKYLKRPLVKLCKKLTKESRALDFHRMVLDMNFREKLLNEG